MPNIEEISGKIVGGTTALLLSPIAGLKRGTDIVIFNFKKNKTYRLLSPISAPLTVAGCMVASTFIAPLAGVGIGEKQGPVNALTLVPRYIFNKNRIFGFTPETVSNVALGREHNYSSEEDSKDERGALLTDGSRQVNNSAQNMIQQGTNSEVNFSTSNSLSNNSLFKITEIKLLANSEGNFSTSNFSSNSMLQTSNTDSERTPTTSRQNKSLFYTLHKGKASEKSPNASPTPSPFLGRRG